MSSYLILLFLPDAGFWRNTIIHYISYSFTFFLSFKSKSRIEKLLDKQLARRLKFTYSFQLSFLREIISAFTKFVGDSALAKYEE